MNPLSRNNPLWKRICVILGSCLLPWALPSATCGSSVRQNRIPPICWLWPSSAWTGKIPSPMMIPSTPIPWLAMPLMGFCPFPIWDWNSRCWQITARKTSG